MELILGSVSVIPKITQMLTICRSGSKALSGHRVTPTLEHIFPIPVFMCTHTHMCILLIQPSQLPFSSNI